MAGKLLVFEPKYVGVINITHENCKIYTGLEAENFISLTGIDGLAIYNGHVTFKLFGKYPLINVELKYEYTENGSQEWVSLRRIIDLQFKEINNAGFYSSVKKTGKGLRVFRSQVLAAIEYQFRSIYVHAIGNYYDENNGYITWGRFGYSMYKPECLAMFNRKLKEANERNIVNPAPKYLSEENLFGVLMHRDGVEFWKRRGDSWYGLFDLQGKSQNIANLNKYLLFNGPLDSIVQLR